MGEASNNARIVTAVVPSLRIDVLGARAFRVSRSYFAKGVASGNVLIGEAAAGKAAQVQPGERVQALGLGEFELLSVDGSTRKGNLRVSLRVQTEPG